LLSGVSNPIKAKNKRSDAEPMLLIVGVIVQFKFSLEIKLAPTITSTSNGISFPNAVNSMKRIPFFTLLILRRAIPPKIKIKKPILKISLLSEGKKYFNVSANALAIAASEITLAPNQ